MSSKAFFHYVLAFAVLFASSFAVFHGNEHIALGKADLVMAGTTLIHAEDDHIGSEQHDHEAPESSEISHSIEPLCEACLLLSSLSAFGPTCPNLSLPPGQSQHINFSRVHSKAQPFRTYLTRAPPGKA